MDSLTVRNTWVSLLLGLAAGFLGLLLVWLTARGVSRPIRGVAAMLRDIASGEGDLTQRLQYPRNDELGELASWLYPSGQLTFRTPALRTMVSAYF